MKLVYRDSDREVVAVVAPGSTSEHILSWTGDVPELAPGYTVVEAPEIPRERGPLKYREDKTVEALPKPDIVNEKVALLEAEIAAIKLKQAEQDTKLAEVDAKAEVLKP